MADGTFPGTGPLRLLYVVGTYPLLTTTFIDREIEKLSAWDVDVDVLAMRRPDPSIPFSERQRALAARTTYLLPARWSTVVAALCFFLCRRPVRLVGTLSWFLTRPHPSLRARAKTLLHVGEGIVASYLVRDRDFEEFHAHFADRAATVAMVGARLLDRSYSLSIHTGADVFVEPVLLAEKLEHARAVTTCTSFNRGHLRDLVDGGRAQKIFHVRHGLDLDLYRPAGDLPSAETPVPMILGVGQLKPRKGFAPLIRACALLRDQGHEFRCSILGEGPQRPELEGLVDELGLAGVVELAGARSPEDVLDAYRSATLFVLPCIESPDDHPDGIPNVLAEAMAVGLPVVSTDLPAVAELVAADENGLLVPSGDVEALAVALAALLEDEELRRRLAASARRAVAETFDLDVNIRRFADNLWPGRVRVGAPS